MPHLFNVSWRQLGAIVLIGFCPAFGVALAQSVEAWPLRMHETETSITFETRYTSVEVSKEGAEILQFGFRENTGVPWCIIR